MFPSFFKTFFYEVFVHFFYCTTLRPSIFYYKMQSGDKS